MSFNSRLDPLLSLPLSPLLYSFISALMFRWRFRILVQNDQVLADGVFVLWGFFFACFNFQPSMMAQQKDANLAALANLLTQTTTERLRVLQVL